MTSRLAAFCWEAHDPPGLARFWSDLLHRELAGDGVVVQPRDATEFPIRFLPTAVAKSGANQLHVHLTSDSPEQQQETVARAVALGGRHLDVGQLPEEQHVVLADPEGNEFCVIEAGNGFLAGCGFLAELACDGGREVGLFWSAALGWPLVWDQDEETAIQSPLGGAKIAWGGPPEAPKAGRNRMHLDLAADGDHRAEVDRLLALGATRDDDAPHAEGRVSLLDPGGNEFCVLTAATPA